MEMRHTPQAVAAFKASEAAAKRAIRETAPSNIPHEPNKPVTEWRMELHWPASVTQVREAVRLMVARGRREGHIRFAAPAYAGHVHPGQQVVSGEYVSLVWWYDIVQGWRLLIAMGSR